MSLSNAFKRVLGSCLENYSAPREWEINGVRVSYKPEPTGVSANKWKKILEIRLAEFEDIGWLDGLRKIVIGDG